MEFTSKTSDNDDLARTLRAAGSLVCLEPCAQQARPRHYSGSHRQPKAVAVAMACIAWQSGGRIQIYHAPLHLRNFFCRDPYEGPSRCLAEVEGKVLRGPCGICVHRFDVCCA